MRLEILDKINVDNIIRMEDQSDTREFILKYSREKHLMEIENPLNIYLGIYENDKLIGFFILGKENGGRQIEFRRIVIDEKGKGFGQQAISELESFCISMWNTDSIWLDVFEFNKRGIHIYEKLGYVKIGEKIFEGNNLLIMEKKLSK